MIQLLLFFVLQFAGPRPAPVVARVLRVGPGMEFSVPSQAAAIARDGDIVEISPREYIADVAVWTANDLVLRGVGGRPHLLAGGASAEGKAIWVIRGNRVTVENLEFSGAKVADQNGAAIRHEGNDLTVRNCYVHDNQEGILTGNGPDSDVLIERSEFANSYGDFNHNIYIGNIRTFTLQFSYIHHATNGHNVKTRARNNYILYNRIMDEKAGRSSYAIDIPNGGKSYIIGNVIQKGVNSENPNVISYAAEGASNPLQEFYLVNNTIVSDLRRGSFLQFSRTPDQARIVNNIFAGSGVQLGAQLRGAGAMEHNLVAAAPGFRSRDTFDYQIERGSVAIDAGIEPGTAGGFNLSPVFEYAHPSREVRRNIVGMIDIGAYEYSGRKL